MRLSRLLAVGGASLLALASSGSAFADATVTPNSGLQDGDTVTVAISNVSVGNIAYVTQCGKNDVDPTFDFTLDCYNAVGTNTPLTGGSGTATLQVFKGVDPVFGLYTCDENNPCWIRVSPGIEDNTSADTFTQITFGGTVGTTTTTLPGTTTTTIDPGTEIDEVPMNVLLPLSAAGVGAAAFYFTRRRRVAS